MEKFISVTQTMMKLWESKETQRFNDTISDYVNKLHRLNLKSPYKSAERHVWSQNFKKLFKFIDFLSFFLI